MSQLKPERREKEIYLAGGCFWGLEKYLSLLPGVTDTEVGYANGMGDCPAYEDVCHGYTGHAETVRVGYDPDRISLSSLLDRYYQAIDPLSHDRQGNDRGVQYRTGIYYADEEDAPVILKSLEKLQLSLSGPVAIQQGPLLNYCKAEEYHQKYLDKNPNGYCHIGQELFEAAAGSGNRPGEAVYRKGNREELKKHLTPLQFEVTQNNATEPPFQNEYDLKFDEGIYVDITTGEPLFLSTNKFDSGSGWPSFTKPIEPGIIKKIKDKSHGMLREEVRSVTGDAHLGHIFPDGPEEGGGMRYCINSAALKFIPLARMEEQGYGALIPLLKRG